jgi:phosphatidylglycerophosphate synthase
MVGVMSNNAISETAATRPGFKPRAVEEWIDFYLHRPLAGVLVNVIKDWSITPNQVTGLSALSSLFAGIAIGLAYYLPWLSAVGGVLLFISIILDCADGQLARVRGTFSEIGRALDGLADGVAPLSVFHGTLFFLSRDYPIAWVWCIEFVVAVSLVWHAVSYDVTKNVYLHCSRPDFSLGGDTLISKETMKKRVIELRAEGKIWDARVMWAWSVWTGPQSEQLARWMSKERTPQNDTERALFDRLFRPLMQASTWLGFGTHLFVLTVGALIAPWDIRALWVAFAVIVFPMNLVGVYVVAVRPKRERQFVEGLRQLREGD